MLRIAFTALTLVTAPFAASAQPQGQRATHVEITQAEDAWRQSRIAGDVAFLERFYAQEARIQGMDGKALSREADIAMFKTGRIKPKFITHGPLNISTYGDVAVVTGVDHLGGTAFGRYGEMYLRFTDVLIRRDGRWQLVVQQATSTTGFCSRLFTHFLLPASAVGHSFSFGDGYSKKP